MYVIVSIDVRTHKVRDPPFEIQSQQAHLTHVTASYSMYLGWPFVIGSPKTDLNTRCTQDLDPHLKVSQIGSQTSYHLFARMQQDPLCARCQDWLITQMQTNRTVHSEVTMTMNFWIRLITWKVRKLAFVMSCVWLQEFGWQKDVLGEKQVAGTVSGWISYVFLSLLGLPYPEPNQANELSPILIHTNKA